MHIPTATYLGRSKSLALATVPFSVAAIWGSYHLIGVARAVTGRGNPLALTWLVAFMLLWWVILAWFERPYTVTPRKARWVERLRVTVSIPAFNEPEHLLKQCIESLLAQSRLPQRIRVVDDGSSTVDYTELQAWFHQTVTAAGVEGTWKRTVNRGKRHAQMEVLADDDADIYMTLDSDTILDRHAVEEGLKPFAHPDVHSVAGMVVVWNSRENWLSFLTCMLYTPFTRGFRSAQGVLGRVMVNSGTLAFYRGATIRKYAGVYENETFLGRPMQMNDDSMMTFYGLLAGKAVHQPTSVAYTIVPTEVRQYCKQQLRWMRGTLVRTAWWMRYFPLRDPAWWMPVGEMAAFFLSLTMVIALVANPSLIGDARQFFWSGVIVGVLINYTVSLRYFIIRRSDEPFWFQFVTFLAAPLAGLWRLAVLRLMMLYAMCTFWKIGSWGTRGAAAEVDEATVELPVIPAALLSQWARVHAGGSAPNLYTPL